MLRKMSDLDVVSDDGRRLRIQYLNDYIAYMEGKKGLYIGMKSNWLEKNAVKFRVEIDAATGFRGWMQLFVNELKWTTRKP